MESLQVAVTGSTGFIGSALCAKLESDGHQVIRVVRSNPSNAEIGWKPSEGTIDAGAFEGLDAVVHLAGAPIAGRRWSDSYRKELTESRTMGTQLLAKTLADAQNGPKRFLSGSAIGFYGNQPSGQKLTETSNPGTGFLPDMVKAWEASTEAAEQAGVSVAHLRTGIVLHPSGGALSKMLPLFKFGLGGKFGSGKQWMSWISLSDEVNAIIHLLGSQVQGPVNLTAPAPVTNSDFTKALSSQLSRPALLPVPAFGPKLLLGSDLAQALLFDSANIVPEVLTGDDYSFAHPDLPTALADILS